MIMDPSQQVKLASDANELFYKIEKTKNFGEKLDIIRDLLLSYYKLGGMNDHKDLVKALSDLVVNSSPLANMQYHSRRKNAIDLLAKINGK